MKQNASRAQNPRLHAPALSPLLPKMLWPTSPHSARRQLLHFCPQARVPLRLSLKSASSQLYSEQGLTWPPPGQEQARTSSQRSATMRPDLSSLHPYLLTGVSGFLSTQILMSAQPTYRLLLCLLCAPAIQLLCCFQAPTILFLFLNQGSSVLLPASGSTASGACSRKDLKGLKDLLFCCPEMRMNCRQIFKSYASLGKRLLVFLLARI